jgi:hypothetical protein
MTTQAVSLTVGNSAFSKIFADTATDGVWSGNIGLDTIANQNLGILIPGAPLNFYQGKYAAGVCAWRIQNAATLQVSTRGFCVKDGQTPFKPDGMMPPISVNPNDIIAFHPLAIAAAGSSACLAYVYTTKGVELFSAPANPDGASTVITTAVNGQTLGDVFFGSSVQKVCVQVQDGAKLNFVEIVDEMGGVVMTLQGGQRGTTAAAGDSNMFNLDVSGLNVPIGKGWTLKLNTTAA